MARPTDWDILALDHDPTPGDPQRVKDISGLMRGIGDDAERAARDVRGLAGDDAVMGWIGASGDAFKTHIGKFPSQLDKVASSHHLCADALLEFGSTLDSVQSQADRALVQARPLHDQVQRLQAQLASAHTDLTSAGRGVTAAQAAATVDPGSVQNAIRTQTNAQSAVDGLNSQLSGPASQLEALKKLAASAESLRHSAEDTARTKIHTATDAGIPPDSFWHKLGTIAGELWHGLVIVAKIVSFVGAIVLMVVGGPVWLIVAVVVAGVIILADTLYKYSQGKASLWDVGLAVLSCIPITKGFTSMAAVADAFRAGGMLGAGLHIAGAIGGAAKDLVIGMAGLLRGGLGRLVGILGDGSKAVDTADAARGADFLPHSGSEAFALPKGVELDADDLKAIQEYDKIRGLAGDVDQIAENTGIDPELLARMKQHIFFDVHENVPVGLGEAASGRFVPSMMNADLWNSALKGGLSKEGLQAFRSWAAHEGVESQLMRDGMPYVSAHPDAWTNDFDMHQGTPTAWGAHDAAPNAYAKPDPATGVPDYFKHWPKVLGLPAPDFKIADDLSNIPDLVRLIQGLPH